MVGRHLNVSSVSLSVSLIVIIYDFVQSIGGLLGSISTSLSVGVKTELKAAISGKPRIRAKGYIEIHHSQHYHCYIGIVPVQTGNSLQSFLSRRACWPPCAVRTHPSLEMLFLWKVLQNHPALVSPDCGNSLSLGRGASICSLNFLF